MVLEQRSTLKGSQLGYAALGKVSAALGVRQSELTLYEVREVKEGMQLAPGTTRLAVAVKNSGELDIYFTTPTLLFPVSAVR